MLFIVLMFAYNKCLCGNKEDDEEEEELGMIDKNLKSVFKNLNAFSTKLTYIEAMLNLTEARFYEKGYRNSDLWSDPAKKNFTIRKFYYQRRFLIDVKDKSYYYYLDKFLQYLI